MVNRYIEDDDVDPERDLSSERKMEIGGSRFIFKREDPYGFWHVYYEKGITPNRLKDDRFTSIQHAEQAVRNYLNDKTSKRREITEKED